MTETLRDKLISKGWVTNFNADTLVRLIEEHYAKNDGPAVLESREPASVTCEPSDEELLELMPQQLRDDLATVSRLAAHGAGSDVGPGLFRVSLNTGALAFARAALARWGNHPGSPDSSTPQPVPVSERLPGAEDCDAEGMCWWWCSPAERWVRCGIPQPDQASQIYTHWLPARALPLPS